MPEDVQRCLPPKINKFGVFCVFRDGVCADCAHDTGEGKNVG